MGQGGKGDNRPVEVNAQRQHAPPTRQARKPYIPKFRKSCYRSGFSGALRLMPRPAPTTRSARAALRAAARERRSEKLERRRTLLDLVVAGYAYEQIANRFQISVATLRREIDRTLAQQAPDSAQRYVALQLARLNKAMLVVDLAMDRTDLRAIPALATLLGEFDRYHGLAALLSAHAPADLQKKAPKSLETLAPSPELHAPISSETPAPSRDSARDRRASSRAP